MFDYDNIIMKIRIMRCIVGVSLGSGLLNYRGWDAGSVHNRDGTTNLERMSKMKKRALSILLVLMLVVSSISTLAFAAEATELYYAKYIPMDGITLDGDLSDWEGVEKYALASYNKEGNSWSTSDYYIQVATSPDSIYVSMIVPDSEKTVDGIVRDQLRIGLITSDGKLGLMYTDCDTWNQTSANDLQGWWGVPATFTENAIIANCSTSVFTYNADGTVTVEARICLKDPALAKTEPALKSGDTFQLAIQYYNKEFCTAQAYAGEGWYTLGTTSMVADTAEEITATFKVGEKPTQETFTYEANAPVGGPEMDIVEGVSNDFETDFWEWVDEEDGLWEAAPKYALDVYDSATGMYVKSETEYVQFKYVYGQLYFRVHAKDADGKSADGLIRDGVYVTVVLPEGEVGRYFLGSDASDGVVWKEWGVEAWFDGTVQDPTGVNAFTNNNTTACFYYADGFVDVEGRVTVKDNYTHYFTGNTELKVGIVYRDNTNVLATSKEGGNWVKWGTTDATNHDAEQVSGIVTLYDPAYRDLEGVKVEEVTDGAENDSYSFDADGNLLVYVKETAGAAKYCVRLFNLFNAPVTWEESDSVKLVVPNLTSGEELAYQVIALNEAGEIIAVYPTVAIVVGVDPTPDVPGPSDPSNPTEPTDPTTPTNPSEPTDPTDPSEPEGPADTSNNNAGVVILCAVICLIVIAAVVGILIAKKKKI